jgi:L-iditol 2-dehydrogenase
MKAARLYGVEDLRVEDTDDPRLEPGEALIRIEACGVCPSDLRRYLGSHAGAAAGPPPPSTPGHEWAGVVLEVARSSATPNDSRIKPGDRVVADWRCICGECYECRRGAFNYCEQLVQRVRGGFAELGAAPLAQLRIVPDGVSFEEASFSEPLACILNAHAQTPIAIGDDVVVLGAGPIGLLHLQVARHRGARVIVVDKLSSRLEAAAALGAHDLVDASAVDSLARVRELTEGRGAAAVIVAVGGTEPTHLGMEMGAINAWVNFFAGTYPTAEMRLDPNLIHYRQLRVTGSHDFTPHHFSAALKLIQYGIVRVEPLITHRFSLDHVVDAFTTTAGRSGLKSMVSPAPSGARPAGIPKPAEVALAGHSTV